MNSKECSFSLLVHQGLNSVQSGHLFHWDQGCLQCFATIQSIGTDLNIGSAMDYVLLSIRTKKIDIADICV